MSSTTQVSSSASTLLPNSVNSDGQLLVDLAELLLLLRRQLGAGAARSGRRSARPAAAARRSGPTLAGGVDRRDAGEQLVVEGDLVVGGGDLGRPLLARPPAPRACSGCSISTENSVSAPDPCAGPRPRAPPACWRRSAAPDCSAMAVDLGRAQRDAGGERRPRTLAPSPDPTAARRRTDRSRRPAADSCRPRPSGGRCRPALCRAPRDREGQPPSGRTIQVRRCGLGGGAAGEHDRHATGPGTE